MKARSWNAPCALNSVPQPAVYCGRPHGSKQTLRWLAMRPGPSAAHPASRVNVVDAHSCGAARMFAMRWRPAACGPWAQGAATSEASKPANEAHQAAPRNAGRLANSLLPLSPREDAVRARRACFTPTDPWQHQRLMIASTLRGQWFKATLRELVSRCCRHHSFGRREVKPEYAKALATASQSSEVTPALVSTGRQRARTVRNTRSKVIPASAAERRKRPG